MKAFSNILFARFFASVFVILGKEHQLSSVTIDATVKNSSTSYYLIKDAPIPSGGSLELIDGGSKVVLQSGDSVEALSDTASAVDCILSVVDSIST